MSAPLWGMHIQWNPDPDPQGLAPAVRVLIDEHLHNGLVINRWDAANLLRAWQGYDPDGYRAWLERRVPQLSTEATP